MSVLMRAWERQSITHPAQYDAPPAAGGAVGDVDAATVGATDAALVLPLHTRS